MSKNPAWTAYNKAVQEANEKYDEDIKPLRAKFRSEVDLTEKHFDDKINPLITERKLSLERLQEAYQEGVTKFWDKNRKEVASAKKILETELKGIGPERSVA